MLKHRHKHPWISPENTCAETNLKYLGSPWWLKCFTCHFNSLPQTVTGFTGCVYDPPSWTVVTSCFFKYLKCVLDLKPCSHVTSACAFASNIQNEFYGSKWWCSHLMLTFLWTQRQRSKENADADVTCDSYLRDCTCRWRTSQLFYWSNTMSFRNRFCFSDIAGSCLVLPLLNDLLFYLEHGGDVVVVFLRWRFLVFLRLLVLHNVTEKLDVRNVNLKITLKTST